VYAANKSFVTVYIGSDDGSMHAFDAITGKHGLEKIKTIGDCYMAASGLPEPQVDHVDRAVLAGLDIVRNMEHLREQLQAEIRVRVGIHCGPLIAGVIGEIKPFYDIWGDTVNTASRMESSGEPGKVNISSSTYEKVKDEFDCTHRGRISAKGKGEIDMYFVEPKA
jgi:class 3 adenylate cyclase